MLSNLKNLIIKFKKIIIYFLLGGTALASGLSGIPQDLYNNLNVKVYSVCDLQSSKRTSIADDLTAFKARNPDNSLRELNAGERAGFKSCEIAKKGTEFAGIYDSIQYGTRIEIIGDVKAIEVNGQHGIELFAKAWKGGKQLGFGKDGSVEIERFRIFNPPILVDDPLGTIIREWTDDITGQLKQRKLREDPLEAIRQVIAHNAKIVGIENAPIVIGKIGNTTSTFYPAAGAASPVDGIVGINSADDTFANIRGGAGVYAGPSDDPQSVGRISASGTTNQWAIIYRTVYGFDTSSIPDNGVISATTLSIFGTSKNDNFSQSIVIDRNPPASDSNLVNADYNVAGWDGVEQSTARITVANWSTTAYNDFTLNATGIGNTSKTGISWFGGRISADFDNSEPTWSLTATGNVAGNFADQAGTTSDPKLVVVYTAAAAAGEEYQIIFE